MFEVIVPHRGRAAFDAAEGSFGFVCFGFANAKFDGVQVDLFGGEGRKWLFGLVVGGGEGGDGCGGGGGGGGGGSGGGR